MNFGCQTNIKLCPGIGNLRSKEWKRPRHDRTGNVYVHCAESDQPPGCVCPAGYHNSLLQTGAHSETGSTQCCCLIRFIYYVDRKHFSSRRCVFRRCNCNKIGHVYSFEYTEITRVFFTPQRGQRR